MAVLTEKVRKLLNIKSQFVGYVGREGMRGNIQKGYYRIADIRKLGEMASDREYLGKYL